MAVITRVMMLSRAREREPLETWRVYGIETRLVGREPELSALNEEYEAVLDSGEPRIVSVTAPTGLGKSRLFDGFQRRLNEAFSSAHVIHGASRDDSGAPYSMFGRMLRDRFYIGEKEHPESARRKLLDAVRSIVDNKDAERLAHLLGELLDLSFEESPYVPEIRDSEGAQALDRRAYAALADVLRADASNDPLVLILEDLQYATNRSLDLVDYLTRHLDGCSVLLILSWNPEEIVSDRVLWDIEFDREIELAPLSDAEVEGFVRDTLRKASDVPTGLVDKITEAAHGNPLSVEEMLRILISQGIVDTRGSEWKIAAERLDDLELPSTVEGTVQARLATLTEDERIVLGMAACVGTVFWPEAVRSMNHLRSEFASEEQHYWSSDTVDTRCDELLESLERKDMIRRSETSSIAGLNEMYFKHRIERAKLYDALPGQDKERYHRLLAQWMERHLDPDDPDTMETIASHYDRGRCLQHAADRYLNAAAAARSNYENERAIHLYVKGLSYLTDADLETKLTGFAELGSVYALIGEYDQALAYYREMLRYSWLLNDPCKGGAAHNRIGRAYRSLGEYDLAIEHLEKALELFRSREDERGIASTMDDLGKIHWIRGNFEEAEAFYSAALHLRRELDDERSVALSLHHVGSLKLQRGEVQDAMADFREALELRREIGDQQGVVDSYNNLGILCLDRGETEQAISLMEEAMELARRIGYRGSLCFVLNNLGEVHLMSGNASKAEELLREAREVAEDSGERRALFDILRNLGKIALRHSDRETALERINEALRIANQLDSQVLLAVGMESLAEVHAHYVFNSDFRDESLQLAEECYSDAIALLREVGNEGELGKALSSYGRFLIERGDAESGRENLEQAREIFERLEMHSLFDDADQVIGAL
jgi:tetratricopeptide (TPR) repeat protein